MEFIVGRPNGVGFALAQAQRHDIRLIVKLFRQRINGFLGLRTDIRMVF